ncbi:MAG: hypothetical protein FJ033_10960 [Chloroflexi bacterium]|nr:hypothetical protein [Chloroflexota bacterium]
MRSPLRRRRVPVARYRFHLLPEDGVEIPPLEGVLLDVLAGHYRLANVAAIVSEEQSAPLTGESWVPVARVAFLQQVVA